MRVWINLHSDMTTSLLGRHSLEHERAVNTPMKELTFAQINMLRDKIIGFHYCQG